MIIPLALVDVVIINQETRALIWHNMPATLVYYAVSVITVNQSRSAH